MELEKIKTTCKKCGKFVEMDSEYKEQRVDNYLIDPVIELKCPDCGAIEVRDAKKQFRLQKHLERIGATIKRFGR